MMQKLFNLMDRGKDRVYIEFQDSFHPIAPSYSNILYSSDLCVYCCNQVPSKNSLNKKD